MKIRNTVLALLLFGGGLAQAATWTGGNGNFSDNSKWDTGVAPITSAEDKDIVIKGSATVTDNVSRTRNGQNITVGDGAIFDITGAGFGPTNGFAGLSGTTINILNGGKIKTQATKFDVNNHTTINCFVSNGFDMGELRTNAYDASGNYVSLNLGLEGSVNGWKCWTSSINFRTTLTLDTGSTLSGPGAMYAFQTRKLIDMDQVGAGNVLWESGSVVTDLLGNTLTRVTNEADLSLDDAGMGKFYAYNDAAAGGDLMVKYVVKSVPEPSTAMLGLIGLVVLALHRRRK